MSIKLMKIIMPHIVTPFTIILSSCFQIGNFPKPMKYAEIKPIHKKGDINVPNSYRPIAILLDFSKILESLVAKQLQSFMEKNSKEQ